MAADSNEPAENTTSAAQAGSPTPSWIRRFCSWVPHFLCRAAHSIRDDLPHYLTALFTLLLAFFAYKAWNEATNNTRELKDEQRPWVAPVNIFVTPDGNGVAFIQIFKNVGHTPTKTLYIDGTIIDISHSTSDIIQQMCKKTDKVLENEKQPFSLIPESDWELDVNKMPSQKDKPFNIKTVEAMEDPAIIGCVSYHSPFDQMAHHTGYHARIKAGERTVEFIYSAYAN